MVWLSQTELTLKDRRATKSKETNRDPKHLKAAVLRRVASTRRLKRNKMNWRRLFFSSGWTTTAWCTWLSTYRWLTTSSWSTGSSVTFSSWVVMTRPPTAIACTRKRQFSGTRSWSMLWWSRSNLVSVRTFARSTTSRCLAGTFIGWNIDSMRNNFPEQLMAEIEMSDTLDLRLWGWQSFQRRKLSKIRRRWPVLRPQIMLIS